MTAVSPTNITLNVKPDVPTFDLDVTNITVPAAGGPGNPATIMYTVANLSNNAVGGTWTDSVYLSRDITYSPDDLLIGRVEHMGGVGANGNYAETLTAPLPGVIDSDYHVIVIADSRNQLPDSDRDNNREASTSRVKMVTTLLTFGVSRPETIANGQDKYYRLDVPSGGDVRLTAGLTESNQAEFFVAYRRLPTRFDFDFVANDPAELMRQITLVSPQAGAYFVLMHGREGAGAGSPFEIAAEHISFAVNSVSPSRGANLGRLTSTIRGTGFTPETRVSLLQPNGGEAAVATVRFSDANMLFATFDLSGLASGQYAVRVATENATVTLNGVLSVIVGTPGRVETSLSTPGTVRPGREYRGFVEYTNVGDTDVVAPLMFLSGPGSELRPSDSSTFLGSAIQLLGINRDGPAGVLPPGYTGRIPIRFVPTSDFDFELHTLSDPSVSLDWNSVKQQLRPQMTPTDAWDVIFDNFVGRVGSTAGQFQAVLADSATYLSQLGNYVSDVNVLRQFQLELAGGRGDIARRFQSGSFGRGVPVPFDIRAVVDAHGNVEIRYGTSLRTFVKQLDGSFLGLAGDAATLTQTMGKFLLVQQDRIQVGFDDLGRLSFFEDTGGTRITATYADGKLTALTDSFGDTTTYRYNAQGRIDRVTDPLGRVMSMTYDAAGEHLTAITNERGTTSYSYVMSQSPALAHAIESITAADGRRVEYEYDSAGRVTRIRDHLGEEMGRYEYGSAGETRFDRRGVGTAELRFNQFGDLAQTLDAVGGVTSLYYNSARSLTRSSSSFGISQTFGYDSAGNIQQAGDPQGQQVAASFDTTSRRLLSVRDPKGSQTAYEYDNQGNLTSITYVDDSSEKYEYDANGNFSRITNRRGQQTDYVYGNDNLLARETHADGLVLEYTYDAHRNIISTKRTVNAVSEVTSFDYDSADHVTKVTYPNGRFVEFDYDAAGRRILLRDQSGFEVRYEYDEVARLSKVLDGNGQKIVAYTYDGLNRLVREEKANGTSSAYEYDDADRITRIIHRAADTSVLSQVTYTYDALGRRTAMTTENGSFTYGYDGAGQLTFVNFSNGRTITYEYDASGNRIAVRDNGNTTVYASNELDQYTSIGNATLSYDTEGNLISRTDANGTTTFSYDPRGRLTAINAPGDTQLFEYDALGNRSALIHNGQRQEYLIDPLGLANVVAEYNAAGNPIANYVYGFGLAARADDQSLTSFYNFDGNANTIQVTDSLGTVTNEYAYLPFGEFLSRTDGQLNPFTFSGRLGVVDDQNGLFFHRERWYDPAQGRFTQPDLMGIDAGDTNLYRYVHNAPTNLSDPSGRTPQLATQILEIVGRMEAGMQLQAWGATKGLGAVGVGIMEDLQMSGFLQWAKADVELTELLTSELAKRTAAAAAEVAPAARVMPKIIAEANATEVALTRAWMELADLRIRQEARRNMGKAILRGAARFTGRLAAGLVAPLVLDYGTQALFNSTVPTIEAEKHRNDPLGPLGNPAFGEDGRKVLKDCLDEMASGFVSERCRRVVRAIRLARSQDPNEIIGASEFVLPNQTLPYTIHFENLASASAPAVEVLITQQLDPNLDWSTFELGNFGFGDHVIEIPQGRNSFSTRVLLPATAATGGEDLLVDVTAEIDMSTGRVTWKFRAFDPTTGDLPADALAGFLPPNSVSPAGQGFVDYNIRSLKDSQDGTPIDALATIVFDTEPSLDTNVWTNMIDAAAPESNVVALNAETYVASFLVNWLGDDTDGSGVATFDVFVSTDSGPFAIWRPATTETSAIFSGEIGHTYAFYSIATDRVGHVEASPDTSDAVTKVLARPWHNKTKPLDVDGDGFVSPVDALIGINLLNEVGAHELPAPTSELAPPPFYDVNDDLFVSPLDVLLVINFLNGVAPEGSPEAETNAVQVLTRFGRQPTTISMVDSEVNHAAPALKLAIAELGRESTFTKRELPDWIRSVPSLPHSVRSDQPGRNHSARMAREMAIEPLDAKLIDALFAQIDW